MQLASQAALPGADLRWAQAPMKAASFWLEDCALPLGTTAPLPAAVDLLVVGAGYTGLSAAFETATAGQHTLVLDAGPIGGGCSGQNGGQVAYSIKPTLATLSRRHGAALAARLGAEAREAIVELRDLAHGSGLGFDWRQNGCFYAAHTPARYDAMARAIDLQRAETGQTLRLVPRAQLASELVSERYYGGCVYEADASIHPARLTGALHARATSAGAVVHDRCEVTAIRREPGGFSVATANGAVRARRVLIATNGYTGALLPWLRRRVIPLGSYQIATADLGPDTVRQLIPKLRNVGDTRRVIIYLRPSPDGRRILFGGRAALAEADPVRCVPRLRSMLAEIFPSLAEAPVSHAWAGFVAYTFDTLPHLGEHEGIHYCLGYCGQGIPLATYYGRRIGRQIAGRPGANTALDGLGFKTRPLYSGTPWFLAPSILAYRWLDRLGL